MICKEANWPAPKNIRALSTTRFSGFSKTPFDNNNLGLHVGDDPELVIKNRNQLTELFQLPSDPCWMDQTHSTDCVIAENDPNRRVDAIITRSKKHPLIVLTADCLPITLCNVKGTEIAAIHAGWRGLLNGVIENTLSKMESEASNLLAWIGPAICHRCFEVGSEVYDAFITKYPQSQKVFKRADPKWFANLPKIAEMILNTQGITAVYQSNLCTFERKDEFYSYRRESQTGRIGTLIWFND